MKTISFYALINDNLQHATFYDTKEWRRFNKPLNYLRIM